MTLGAEKDWREEFGLDLADASLFYADKSDIARRGGPTSQAHVIRHAFDLLGLDGALCTEHAPLIYFKKVHRIDANAVAEIHRKFWSHGGAPVLVLITRDDVHVYSGLVRPVAQAGHAGSIPALVDTLRRASVALRELLPALESGEFFRRHARSFDPTQRVDRSLLDNLEATRQKLLDKAAEGLDTRVLDALLCRLVFACYLFDRGVIGPAYLELVGVPGGKHLRDVLSIQPRSKSRQHLYALFEKLGEDFNGDLFRADLNGEARLVTASHIGILDAFFRGTDVETGQQSFWPYDFSAIPVEVISAIYERFLQDSDRSEGSFYTPRFLAEAVLDIALGPMQSLLGRRYLDPACGSGIFLVGLFNRMAEEWKRNNPNVRNNRRALELRKILCDSLFGIDINPTACRITAFSLYLAYLDQLDPRDIQDLQNKGHKLPRLVHDASDGNAVEGNIWRGDFFDEVATYPTDIDLVIGNPPWGSTAVDNTPAARWCASPGHPYPLPDKQIATAFIWKAAHHAGLTGRISLVLPHGTLFNHSDAALNFQRAFIARYSVDHVLNLTDYQFFLFAEAHHPAVVITYGSAPPTPNHQIEYWAPKTDWLVKRAELMTISPEDRSAFTTAEVLDDLQSPDAPQVWKQHYWTTARDRRFVERLGLHSRLRDHVRQVRDRDSKKRWLIAEGFQPAGENDLAKAVKLQLPSCLFVKATSPALDLVLRPYDCEERPTSEVLVRSRSNKATDIFHAPHVLVAKGFTRTAFADFDVSFQHAVRGICGPQSDRARLAFLAAYLRSSLAKYFLFHTSTNWGVSRQEVHVEELLRLPFPMPEEMSSPSRAAEIVREVASIVTHTGAKADEFFVDRTNVVRRAGEATEPLIAEYFDLLPTEKVLVEDTVRTIIPSVRPTLKRKIIPTIEPAGERERDEYTHRLCETLNGWGKRTPYRVHGHAVASSNLGVGIAFLQKVLRAATAPDLSSDFTDLLGALDDLARATAQRLNIFEVLRGTKIFDGDRLYVVKPLSFRFWTQTAALNDADEIAGTILMNNAQRPA
jgi:hypothetical protein